MNNNDHTSPSLGPTPPYPYDDLADPHDHHYMETTPLSSAFHLNEMEYSSVYFDPDQFKIKVKKLDENATLPTRAYDGDLGYDLYALHELGPIDRSHRNDINRKILIKIPTGIAIQMPKGWGCFIKERSSLGSKGHEVRAGVVDNGYQGDIMVVVEYQLDFNNPVFHIQKGQKIAQFVPIPIPNFEIMEVDEFNFTSERSDKGFGSSGI